MNVTVPFDAATDPAFISFLSRCPFRWQGDIGAQNWLADLYRMGAPAAAPVLTALTPNTGPANTDITLSLTGTGFDPLATVNIGTAFGLVPTSVTPTELSVLVAAVNIAQAGTLAVSVKNPDGQLSNTLEFTVT